MAIPTLVRPTADLDDFGYPVMTTVGVVCGNCKFHHANSATVRACYSVAAEEKAEMEMEIEAEKRATRYWEEGF